jgi:hypothetical protein
MGIPTAILDPTATSAVHRSIRDSRSNSRPAQPLCRFLIDEMTVSTIGKHYARSTPISGREFLRFFDLSVTTSLKILGAVIPRRVFTQVRRETGKE